MYHFNRRIHLAASLALLFFVLMYFATGFVMFHEQWFKRSGPSTTTHTVSLQYAGDGSDDGMSQYLQDAFQLRGKRQPAKARSDGSKQFLFNRPGTVFEAVVSPDGKQATIDEKKFGIVNMVHGIHRLHGYNGGWFYCLWAFICDLAGLALIVFALTGIYLWCRFSSKRIPGLICLGLSFGFTAAMIVYLMTSK